VTDQTATKLKTLTGMRGDAAVYRLDPPHFGTEYVVVSAVDLNFFGSFGNDGRTSETMIFACADAEGEDINYGDLALIPYKSHADALAELDYVIA
jgi:hypothetical protein